MSKTWFYSDPHFDHENIIAYCNRPFLSKDIMNEHLLKQYNMRVKPDDIVYFLGDMSFGRGSRKPEYWLGLLNGDITYIKGSHDEGIDAEGYYWLDISGEKVLLVHNPKEALLVPDYHGEWIVHGHTHHYTPQCSGNRINVSCDVTGFRPVTIDYIKGWLYQSKS